MFYISDINGNLIPFTSSTPLASLAVTPNIPIATVDSVTNTDSIQAVLDETVDTTSVQPPVDEEAVIIEPPAVLLEELSQSASYIPVSQEISSPNIGRAGAMTSYVTGNNVSRVAENIDHIESRSIQSIAPVSGISVAQKQNDSPYVPVTPAKKTSSGSYQSFIPTKERKPALIAADIMTYPVLALRVNDDISFAHRVFQNKKFRHLPIVSEQGKLIGIISDRDFIPGAHSSSITIRDIMASNILTARPETLISSVAQIMVEYRVGALPIINDKSDLVGIVTRSDILKAIVRHAPIEMWT